MKTINLLLGMAMLAAVGCQQSKPKEAVVEEVPSEFVKLTKIWETDTTLLVPESVIYDEFRDVLYVSNIAGTPNDSIDGDGFISIVSTDGEVINRDWVTGGISSMKGMGIVDSSLFVTDLLSVVEIDIPSGKIIKVYEVEGAGFLNDITIGPDKTVYISDSRTSTIHMIKDGELSQLLSDSTLGGTNGLLSQGNNLIIAGFNTGELHSLDLTSMERTVVADSLFQGDGIMAMGDDLIVSCWRGVIYQVKPDGTTGVILDTQKESKSSADAWYVAATKTLYVPTFFGNTVAAYLVE